MSILEWLKHNNTVWQRVISVKAKRFKWIIEIEHRAYLLKELVVLLGTILSIEAGSLATENNWNLYSTRR